MWSVFTPDPRQWNETTHSGVETLFAGIGLIHRSFELISMFGKTEYAVRIVFSCLGCELYKNVQGVEFRNSGVIIYLAGSSEPGGVTGGAEN